MIIINRILIGCSKLVVSSYVAGAKKRARALSKPATKRLVSISSILKLNRTGNNENKKFRPSDLRKQLPDEIKNIQAADLSDTLRYLSNLNMVTKTKRDRGKRGSPPRSSEEALEKEARHLDQVKRLWKKRLAT
jgi:DNA-binding HxlR family transcriptional regulator